MDKQAFALDKDIIYLNHAGVSPWPVCVEHAINAFTKENTLNGAQHYPNWLLVEKSLRQRCANLLHTTPENIALLKSTSEAISFVASGLEWNQGDNVVISNMEFPSNRIPWEAQQHQGVEVRVADLSNTDQPEQALLDLVDDRTRVLAISSVQYGTGLRIDLQKLGAALANSSALFCIDAIQSLGITDLDAEQCHADFVMADGHKWMMGPEGIALFYSSLAAREQLKVLEFGWHMVENHGDYDTLEWEVAKSARRFECGSPNMLGVHALNASLGLIEQLGIENICREVAALTGHIITQTKARSNLRLVSPEASQRRLGIVTFKPDMPAEAIAKLHKQLMQNNVICAYRAGGIRFAPHYYNTKAQIDAAFAVLDDLIA